MRVFARYGEVLRGHGTLAPLLASVVGRFSLGMTSLALLLMVRESTGSYADAGLVSGAYALSFGVFGPARARSADRSGPVRVLLLTSALHPVLLGATVLVTGAGVHTALLVVVAALAGASVPPLGPVMRALWASVLSGRQLATAYSLESVVVELCFIGGPLLVAGLSVLLSPAAAVVASAVLAGVGGLWLASTTTVRAVQPHPTPHGSRWGPLSAPAVRPLLLTVLAIGAGFGAVEVAVPAFVEAGGGRPAEGGVLLAVWSCGSVVGGLVYGGLHLRTPHRTQLPVLVTALALGSCLPLLASGPITMGVALLLYGATIAPILACNAVLLGEASPAGTVTEAFAWNSSSIFGGAAFASGAAGVLAERSGPTAALAVVTAAGGFALAASAAAWWRSAEPAPT